MALVAATFILGPKIVQAEEWEFFVEPGDGRVLRCEFTGQQAHIEETVFCQLRVGNGMPVDGSFYLFLKEPSFRVDRCPDFGRPDVQDDFTATGACAGGPPIEVPRSDPRWERFVGFWAFSVTTRPVVTRTAPGDRDVAYDGRYREICSKQSLEAFTGGDFQDDFNLMCHLGLVRSISGTNAFADSGEPTYERQYYLGMTLRDDGTDQTEFRGWRLHFDFVVRAKVPADDACPTERVNGVCSMPAFMRT